MAEIIQNKNERLDQLVCFTRDLINRKEVKQLLLQHRTIVDTITPSETMQVFDRLLNEGLEFETVKSSVGKIINVFYRSLGSFNWEKPGKGHFLYYLMFENREVEKLMNKLKAAVKAYNIATADELPANLLQLKQLIYHLKDYELHYIKKENLLFPFIEKTFPRYKCLQLMWSFHDDFRSCMKVLINLLQQEVPDKSIMNKELGRLFFIVMPVIFREEQIIYPVAIRAIPENAWNEMFQQSFETGWCYIEPPIINYYMEQHLEPTGQNINLGTGILNPEQIILMLNNLPVDITFVDEKDEVCYFSGGVHRIFPRSNAIIGRKVQNCHPPESVHIVNEIIKVFRNGEKNVAEFWISMQEKFIHICYYAVRNEHNEYKGTIEVSQDVTDIRALQGQKKLLDWNTK
jgi:uncharacterized protein